MEENNINFEVVKKTLPEIAMNYDEVREILEKNLERFKNINVVEDNLSECKATQKTLAGLRNQIDKYRKDIKKEMSDPITKFESQCKNLIELVKDTEKPIAEGIQVFDDKVREAKRQYAQDIIDELLSAEPKLDADLKNRLVVKDAYTNLTASKKSIKADIEKEYQLLIKDQSDRERHNQTIETHIMSLNDMLELANPMKLQDFKRDLQNPGIIAIITERANALKKAEEAAKNAVKKEEEVVIAELEPMNYGSAREVGQGNLSAPETVNVPSCNTFILEIQATNSQANALSNFLKSENIKYQIKRG